MKKPERIIRGVYKEMEEERAGKGRWNKEKAPWITALPDLARIFRRKKQRLCYNPPANYKVLANGSTRWPTDRGSWPTGQPIGQRVGLGEWVSPLANGLTYWPTGQFSRPIHQEQKLLTHPPRTFHAHTNTPSTFLNIVFVTNHIYVTAAI